MPRAAVTLSSSPIQPAADSGTSATLLRSLPAIEPFEADYYRARGILPVAIAEGRLLLAAIDSPAPELLDELEVAYGVPIETVRVTREQLAEGIRNAMAPSEDGRTGPTTVTLCPLDDDAVLLAAGWLAEPANYRWLDFGAGEQLLTARRLKLMLGRDTHRIRLFGVTGTRYIGIVGVSDVSRDFGTATLWYLLGDKRFAGQGYTTRAVAQLLDEAFTELSLHSVGAWTVTSNLASISVLQHNHFQLVGRRRACHMIAGQCYDRLIFDLLASEHHNHGG